MHAHLGLNKIGTRQRSEATNYAYTYSFI